MMQLTISAAIRSLALGREAPSRSLGPIFSPTQDWKSWANFGRPSGPRRPRRFDLIRSGKGKSAPSLRSGFPLGVARGRLQRARTPAKRLNFDFAQGSASRCSASAGSLALGSMFSPTQAWIMPRLTASARVAGERA